MLTNLVKRLTRLEPVSPVRKGIVSLSIGDFSEEQLLALPMLCRAREIGRRSEIGCEISVLTPVCAAPLPQPNPWKAQTLYGLLALFANDRGRAIDGLLTLWLPDPQHENEACALSAALIDTYAVRQLQERGVRRCRAREEADSGERS
jgi:hypothetical protein